MLQKEEQLDKIDIVRHISVCIHVLMAIVCVADWKKNNSNLYSERQLFRIEILVLGISLLTVVNKMSVIFAMM